LGPRRVGMVRPLSRKGLGREAVHTKAGSVSLFSSWRSVCLFISDGRLAMFSQLVFDLQSWETSRGFVLSFYLPSLATRLGLLLPQGG
jgi:hypothetical protein